ncbi:uncharacterized protein DEA37_0002701 [Paragonimus westermani]|uniref:Heme-binding protein 2 n=1 Tax=Paragonimus westermani TaxID=34504 RepID=A0A5J4NLX3_9TREM|nr:uncharacterized protein DEA37_0002701 [Paragonimus westermani]
MHSTCRLSVKRLRTVLRQMGLFGTTQIAPYEVVQEWKVENVQLRQYPAQTWVCTKVIASKMDDMSSPSFFKLFNYIRGDNVENRKIAMTKPVTIESKPNPDSALTRIFTMGFYLPGDAPPSPKAADVFIEHRPQMNVYCCLYPGFSNDHKLMEEARKLSQSLDNLRQPYNNESFYFAGYDAPFRLFNRRNEIWFPVA